MRGAILRWAHDRKVGWHYVARGKLSESAFIERVIGARAAGPRVWREYVKSGPGWHDACGRQLDARGFAVAFAHP